MMSGYVWVCVVMGDLAKRVGGQNNGMKKTWNQKWRLENEQKKMGKPGHEIRGQRKRQIWQWPEEKS